MAPFDQIMILRFASLYRVFFYLVELDLFNNTRSQKSWKALQERYTVRALLSMLQSDIPFAICPGEGNQSMSRYKPTYISCTHDREAQTVYSSYLSLIRCLVVW
uniref:Uncharacterized protein n=1 Tax=Hyaloperonospora arabidopsidis (strain Emoy2) TaxID=559515 RepID=M4BTP6_HYAAE